MKNRALLLCLKNNINIYDYASYIGATLDEAQAIWNENGNINPIYIDKSCELFKCRASYFLALTEE